jgi:hypothetical protein
VIIRIYHNVTRDTGGRMAGFDGYQTGHLVTEVLTYHDTGQSAEVLERAFHTFNVGEDELAQQYRARKLRSLSFPGKRPCCGWSRCSPGVPVWLFRRSGARWLPPTGTDMWL